MKKFLIAVTAVCLITLVSVVSCKKDDPPADCTGLVSDVTTTGTSYGAAPTTERCQAYRIALQNYLKSSCANSLSAEEKTAFQDQIDGLNCP